MQKQAIPKEPVASYKEVRIGKTLYRVTSVFSGEKDLGRTLEQLAVRRAMTELDAPATAHPCYASQPRRRQDCGRWPVWFSAPQGLRHGAAGVRLPSRIRPPVRGG